MMGCYISFAAKDLADRTMHVSDLSFRKTYISLDETPIIVYSNIITI